MAQASKGGEIGLNGEFYEGGKFLPNTTLPKRSPKASTAKVRKVEIAPYEWTEQPSADARSLYRLFDGTFGKVRNGRAEYVGNDQILAYAGLSRAEAENILDRWNNGERWA